MNKKSKAFILTVGLIVIALLSISVFYYSKNKAESNQVDSVITPDLEKVAKVIQGQKLANYDRVTATNCIITSGGVSDISDGSKEALKNFAGSSMTKGQIGVQLRKTGQKSTIKDVKTTPGTCIVLYPLDPQGNIDLEKGDSIKNGYVLVGARKESKLTKLPVYSSQTQNIDKKTYNSETGKLQ